MKDGDLWYETDESLLTKAEKDGRVPVPSKVAIVVYGKNRWFDFRELLRETGNVVERSFRGTSLEGKSTAYKLAMPREDERGASFLFRHMQKMKATSGMMAGIASCDLEGFCNADEFNHYFLSTGLYTGEEPQEVETIESRRFRNGVKSVRTRVVPVFRNYDIGFQAGFNYEDRWFFSAGLEDSSHGETYDSLVKGLRGIDVIAAMGSPRVRVDQESGTEFMVFQ